MKLGVGGKMGSGITANLMGKRYGLLLCEKAERAVREIEEMGLKVTPAEEAVPQSDVVVLVVPDALISQISETVVPMMRRNATLILLDPAVSYVDECLMRKDCTFVVTHPCHPDLFSSQIAVEVGFDKVVKENWREVFDNPSHASPQKRVSEFQVRPRLIRSRGRVKMEAKTSVMPATSMPSLKL